METRLYKCWVKICVFLTYQKIAEILSLLSTEPQFLYTRVDSIVGICWVINMCGHKLIYYHYLLNYFEKHYLTFLCKINMFMAILIFCFSSTWSQLLCAYQVANKLKTIFGLHFAPISHVCTLYWRLCNYTTNLHWPTKLQMFKWGCMKLSWLLCPLWVHHVHFVNTFIYSLTIIITTENLLSY